MSAYTDRPPLWAWLLTPLLAAGMTTAGFWQYGRGIDKQALIAARAQAVGESARPLLADARAPSAGERRAVTVEGVYVPELTVQLDNQPHRDRPGVHVWTPLRLATGEIVIIDRGWLPLDAVTTAPLTGPQSVKGHWRRLPTPGMRLGESGPGCISPRPARVTYPDLAAVRCLFGDATLDGVLELDAAAPGGFVREWETSGAMEIPPSRHFAYAGQWWFFTLTLIVLFISLNLKKRHA